MKQRSIDVHPQVPVSEIGRFIPSGDGGDSTLAPDMLDRLWPWCCNLDENVVLKYLARFTMNLLVDREDASMVLVIGWIFDVLGRDLTILGKKKLAVDLLTDLCRVIQEAQSHFG